MTPSCVRSNRTIPTKEQSRPFGRDCSLEASFSSPAPEWGGSFAARKQKMARVAAIAPPEKAGLFFGSIIFLSRPEWGGSFAARKRKMTRVAAIVPPFWAGLFFGSIIFLSRPGVGREFRCAKTENDARRCDCSAFGGRFRSMVFFFHTEWRSFAKRESAYKNKGLCCSPLLYMEDFRNN